MNPPLTADVLEQMGCSTPDCGHDHSELYLHSHCHPDAPVWPHYIKADHMLIFECAECDKEVARVLVATAQ